MSKNVKITNALRSPDSNIKTKNIIKINNKFFIFFS